MSTYKRYAPKCALPYCTNLVSYKKKEGNHYRWHMFCSPHKGALKAEVDNWKMGKGCENKDLRHGFLCTSHITDVTQLDVNHRDGNRHNQDPDNLEILCKICHQRVTMDNKHHVNRYRHEVILNPDLFEF